MNFERVGAYVACTMRVPVRRATIQFCAETAYKPSDEEDVHDGLRRD